MVGFLVFPKLYKLFLFYIIYTAFGISGLMGQILIIIYVEAVQPILFNHFLPFYFSINGMMLAGKDFAIGLYVTSRLGFLKIK